MPPAPTITIDDQTWQIKIAAGVGLNSDEPTLTQILTALRGWKTHTPLQDISCKRDAQNLTDYAYKFKAIDGRKFNQVLRRNQDGTWAMSFTSQGDFWRSSELEPHRTVREKLCALIDQFGVSTFEVSWA